MEQGEGHRQFGLRTNHTREKGDAYLVLVVNHSTEAQITNPQIAGRSIDKDVVTFEVAMDDGRVLRMQILQPLQNLNGPSFGNLPSNDLNFVDEALESSGRQNLGDKDDLLLLAIHP